LLQAAVEVVELAVVAVELVATELAQELQVAGLRLSHP